MPETQPLVITGDFQSTWDEYESTCDQVSLNKIKEYDLPKRLVRSAFPNGMPSCTTQKDQITSAGIVDVVCEDVLSIRLPADWDVNMCGLYEGEPKASGDYQTAAYEVILHPTYSCPIDR